MKNVCASVLLLLFSLNSVSAQELGQTILGGSFQFSQSKQVKVSPYYYSYGDYYNSYNEESNLEIGIAPVIGTMISEKTAIGVQVGLLHVKRNAPDFYSGGGGNYELKSSFLFVAPFVRIHNNITENFKYFIEPSLGKVFGLWEDSSSDVQQLFAGVGAGIIYFPTKKISLELNVVSINYQHYSIKDTDIKTNELSIDYNLATPNLGLKFYL